MPVCSLTGSSVVDFNGIVHSIPDRCVYSLVKPQGSSSFELLAGFQERRRLGVPFLDYLKLSLQKPDVTFLLEQGGRVQVRRKLMLMERSFLQQASSRSIKGAQELFWSIAVSKLLRFVTEGPSLLCVNVGQWQLSPPEQYSSDVLRCGALHGPASSDSRTLIRQHHALF